MFVINNTFAKPKSDELVSPFSRISPCILRCGLTWTRCMKYPLKTCNGSEFRLNIDIELHMCISNYFFFPTVKLVGRWTGPASETVDRKQSDKIKNTRYKAYSAYPLNSIFVCYRFSRSFEDLACVIGIHRYRCFKNAQNKRVVGHN